MKTLWNELYDTIPLQETSLCPSFYLSFLYPLIDLLFVFIQWRRMGSKQKDLQGLVLNLEIGVTQGSHRCPLITQALVHCSSPRASRVGEFQEQSMGAAPLPQGFKQNYNVS